MAWQVVKSKRINGVSEFMDIQTTASDVGVGIASALGAPNYVMGLSGGTAGQFVRLTNTANRVVIAHVDTPSNATNIVGMLTEDATSGVSAVIQEFGRYDGTFTALTIGTKWLGTAGLPVDAPPLVSAGSVRQPLGFAPAASAIHIRIGEMKIN